MLVVLLGRPVALTSLIVRRAGAGPRESGLRVSFNAVQQEPSLDLSAARLRSFDDPGLLLPDDEALPFERLVPAWLALQKRHSDVVMRLCAPHYTSFIFGEHRYASTFQSAEGLAKALYGGGQRSRAEHKQRVRAVAETLEAANYSDEDVDWVRAALAQTNNKRLVELLTELIAASGELGALVPDDFPKLATKLRIGVSHGGTDHGDAARLYWAGQVLHWIVRLHLVRELGVPAEEVEGRVLKKPQLEHALNALAKLASDDDAEEGPNPA
jgi:hypothetical protein